jgi:cbb3-type cytochrome oxidase maturation protein
MYFPYFLSYMSLGLLMAFLAFFWALKNDQFADQQRARFLPLEAADYASKPRSSRMSRWEIYGLVFLACAGLAASAAVIVCALLWA